MTFKQRITLAILMLTGLCASATELPRPEYPRPQFERADWINLNGEWTYAFDFVNSGWQNEYPLSKGFDQKIIVPFAPESSLSGVGHTDFINNIWYHRTFTVPSDWSGKRIRLNFGAVYYTAEVYVDGTFVGRHFGGSTSFSYDITDYLKEGSEHDLVVKASSDLRSTTQTAGKQSLKLKSMLCSYTRTTGIWQTVWMEHVAQEGLSHVQVTTDIDQKQVVIRPKFYRESAYELNVVLKEGSKIVATKTVSASNNSLIVMPIKKMRLWSLEDPFLYDVTYQVIDKDGRIIDEVESYIGMRKVHSEGKIIYLNNEPIYQRLVLDQGFYPDGIWTAPSDEALRRDIELSKAAGFNGARLHQKVFEERFHYWADKLGYLTWGETASWGMDANNIEAARNFLSEWTEEVIRDRNHPSIIVWTPFNEEWWPDKVQYPRFMADVYELTKELDPTRLVNTVSGGVCVKETDIWTGHNYSQSKDKITKAVMQGGKMFVKKEQTYRKLNQNIGFNSLADENTWAWPAYDHSQPYMIDEMGGIKWIGNTEKQRSNETNDSWGYGENPMDIEEFYSRLEEIIDAFIAMSENVWGYCYTQLTDVEQEQNGIYNYDRSTKFDMERIRAIFSKEPVKQ